MFHIIKLIIMLVGIVTITYFTLPYFGYEINANYFTESKEECQKRLNDCGKELIEQGTKNANCEFDCLNPKLIIKQSAQ